MVVDLTTSSIAVAGGRHHDVIPPWLLHAAVVIYHVLQVMHDLEHHMCSGQVDVLYDTSIWATLHM